MWKKIIWNGYTSIGFLESSCVCYIIYAKTKLSAMLLLLASPSPVDPNIAWIYSPQICSQGYIRPSSTSPILKYIDRTWLWENLYRMCIYCFFALEHPLCTKSSIWPYRNNGYGKYKYRLGLEIASIRADVIQRYIWNIALDFSNVILTVRRSISLFSSPELDLKFSAFFKKLKLKLQKESVLGYFLFWRTFKNKSILL